MGQLKEFVLDAKMWRCGGNGKNKVGNGRTLMINDEGYMCCLGQYMLSCGIRPQKVGRPDNIIPNIHSRCPLLVNELRRNTDFSGRAMEINDNEGITTTERIKQLTALFLEHGIKLTVINLPE